MRGLGPHVLAGPGGLKGLMDAAQPACIKYVDPPDKPLLAPLTVGRIHEISEQKDVTNPKALALAHADAVSKRADATGIRTWEGINELYRAWEDAELCARFQEYELERMRILHARGLNAAVLCVNTGWPRELPDGSIDWSGVDTLLRSLGPDDLLDVHEYWRPDGPRGSAYLSEVGRFFRCPYDAKVFVSECGVDFCGGQRDGFDAHGVTPQQYATQFMAARDIWSTDSRWVGATPFTFGHFLGGDWGSFDWEPWWSAFVEAMKPIADAPRPQIRVRRSSGRVEILELEEYLRGVVPAEMPASWPLEALKAQAVAARSYALACMVKKQPDYDVTDDTQFQVYDPTMIHTRSDRAVSETRGVYLVRDGQPRLTEYKAYCGRADCPECLGKPGTRNRSWPGQMCQYGAQRLADQGQTWRQILQHYYGAVEVRG